MRKVTIDGAAFTPRRRPRRSASSWTPDSGGGRETIDGDGFRADQQELAQKDAVLSSRPGEFHPRALPEPCVKLSLHTAPDVRPLAQTSNGLASSRGSSCCQLASGLSWTMQPLRSSPITGPSSLLRTAPPLCSASVLWSSRF